MIVIYYFYPMIADLCIHELYIISSIRILWNFEKELISEKHCIINAIFEIEKQMNLKNETKMLIRTQ